MKHKVCVGAGVIKEYEGFKLVLKPRDIKPGMLIVVTYCMLHSLYPQLWVIKDMMAIKELRKFFEDQYDTNPPMTILERHKL